MTPLTLSLVYSILLLATVPSIVFARSGGEIRLSSTVSTGRDANVPQCQWQFQIEYIDLMLWLQCMIL